MTALSMDGQMKATLKPDQLYAGLDRVADQLVGRFRRRRSILNAWQEQAAVILEKADHLRSLSEKELKEHLQQIKMDVRRHKGLATVDRVEMLSALVEVAERTLGVRPYAVQLTGTIALTHGVLVEMATGEGKTLTAALAAVPGGWSGSPCHVVTANDYLASRDAANLESFYSFCGVSVGWITSLMGAAEKRANYSKDIVYTTGKELLADFLRDQLLNADGLSAEQRQIRAYLSRPVAAQTLPIMRGINTAIVDEADSVLIDEAVTPLIISQEQPTSSLNDVYAYAHHVAAGLHEGTDFKVDSSVMEISLTVSGEKKISHSQTLLPNLYKAFQRRKELIITALVAQRFYRKGIEYVVEEDQIVIVDEFTGRMMPGRSWRQGLHQAIEAKEGLPVTAPTETLTQLSFQNFFRKFSCLAGLTGTASETAGEFWDVYRLPVVRLPLNKSSRRRLLSRHFCLHEEVKWALICTEIEECHNQGQPVLIGTRSVAKSEHLAGMLSSKQIPFRLLNAVKHEEEAEIIETAGETGQVTIATNMAGRGADIKLGTGAEETGGLRVILTEPHESRRIDRQLAGRCARQGEPGDFSSYAGLNDALLLKELPGFYRWILGVCCRRPLMIKLIALPSVRLAQKWAERRAAQVRKTVLQNDKILDGMLSFGSRNR